MLQCYLFLHKISKSEQTIFSDIKRHYCGNHDRRTVIFTAVNLKASTLLRIKPKNSKGLMYCAITTLLNKYTRSEKQAKGNGKNNSPV